MSELPRVNPIRPGSAIPPVRPARRTGREPRKRDGGRPRDRERAERTDEPKPRAPDDTPDPDPSRGSIDLRV